MNKKLVIPAIIAGIIVPFSAYAAIPYFIDTTIDEPIPTGSKTVLDEKAMMEKKAMEEKAMMEKKAMEEKAMMEKKAMEEKAMQYSGNFVGAGDSIHEAEGNALIVPLEDGKSILRLEDFHSTNGPDLYVYLATDKTASDFVNLGRLKANNGNQNYDIPEGIDITKYDTALIWCKQFSVLFGHAEL